MEIVYIYSLSDENNVIRYVGKTNNIKDRIKRHINESKKCRTHKEKWIFNMLQNNLKPKIEIIEDVPYNEWERCEIYWISQLKCWGFNLLNGTSGGEGSDGFKGKKHNEKSKEKIRLNYLENKNIRKLPRKIIGNENFKCEILEFLPDKNLLKEREKQLINEEQLKDPMCMNLTVGGGDGFYYINKYGNNNKVNQCSLGGRLNWIKIKSNPELIKKNSKFNSKKMKIHHQEGKIKYNTFKGKIHSEDTIEKMKGHKRQVGENNSQFGTFWITDGKENKKIKKDSEIPQGWHEGRIIYNLVL